MMKFVTEYQFALILWAFVLGLIGTTFLFRKPSGHRAWRLADLVWVVLGGFGALIAVMAGVYKADSSRLDRQIDIAYAATAAFDKDAARFRLRFCDPAYDPDTAILCEKVEFLSASTATNSELPLFLAVTRDVAPLQGLTFLTGKTDGAEMDETEEMRQQVEEFDVEQFLVFTALDEPTLRAVENMQRKVPVIAGDFRIIARSYDALIEQVGTLKAEWEFLRAHAHILAIQIIALSLVSFAAPFRLGKAVVDLFRK